MVMCKTCLAQGLTLHICSTSPAHKQVGHDDDDGDSDNNDGDDENGPHMSHHGEKAHFSFGNSQVT